jgi:hypothetical protein
MIFTPQNIFKDFVAVLPNQALKLTVASRVR